ncbi:MAG: hypothetical protein WC637_08735 [Victivallales bacterium]|jgi:hypothetical protein
MNYLTQDLLNELCSCGNSVHRNIWARFLGDDCIMHDYAGLNGEVILPTADECRMNKPNALAWWTPIENGGFFNGDYLLGLLAGYKLNQNERLRSEIRRLASGLYRLQDICSVDGCIARGIGSDGECHYPASSNDQVFPWLLALWLYSETNIPEPSERRECRKRLLRELRALQVNKWIIPGDLPGFERGSFLCETTDLECRLSSVHITAATLILAELEDASAQALHLSHLNAVLKNGKSRKEFLAEGFPELADWHCWFTSHSVYALRELCRRSDDPELKRVYRNALSVTGKAASAFISRWNDFKTGAFFTPDWRIMLSGWKEQHSCREAVDCAAQELKIWSKASPAIAQEKRSVMVSLSASWIVMLSDDRELIENSLPEIAAAVRALDYDKLHYAAFFYAENVVHEIMHFSLNSDKKSQE